jgi:hypothetical protein
MSIGILSKIHVETRQEGWKDIYSIVIVGALNQRNFITTWLESGEIFISFDDDVQTIKMMEGFNIYWLIADAITKIKTHDYGLASVLPNSDGRRFKTGFTRHLAHVIGSFYICRNNHSLLLDNDPVIQEAKEDIYRTLQYFIVYGQILRYRCAGVQTVYRQANGGIESLGRRERDQAACVDLLRRYPRFVKHIDKKSGWPDVLLWWRARNADA